MKQMKQSLMPFKWPGSKFRLLSWLYQHFPTNNCFVDVFGGSGAVLLHKKPSRVEVFNDLDSALINFFLVIQNPETLKQFTKKTQWTLYSRELFLKYSETWKEQEDPVEKAYQWWCVARMAFRGIWREGHKTWQTSPIKSFRNDNATKEFFMAIHKRFEKVYIENRSFEKIIQIYDNIETLFYLDPPYPKDIRKSQRKIYESESTENLHTDLVNLLLDIKGMAVLSGYETEIYTPLLEAGWRLETKHHDSLLSVPTTKGKTSDDNDRVECLYISPRAQERIQGVLF